MWTDDFAKVIEPGVECPVCSRKYNATLGKGWTITKVDYIGYTWKCSPPPNTKYLGSSHNSISFIKYGYDSLGKFLFKKKETENEFGPVTP